MTLYFVLCTLMMKKIEYTPDNSLMQWTHFECDLKQVTHTMRKDLSVMKGALIMNQIQYKRVNSLM